MKYKLNFNGGRERTARSMYEAIRIARQVLGAQRVYRGAQYVTDTDWKDGQRRTVDALDIWKSRSNAGRQMDAPADCVISW